MAEKAYALVVSVGSVSQQVSAAVVATSARSDRNAAGDELNAGHADAR